MQAPLRKKTDMKLFILYLMRKIDYPMDFTTLNDISSVDGIISSFDFADCFAELLGAGNIESVKTEEGELFRITDRGCNVVDELYDMLIPSLRESALKSAMHLISFKKSGYRVSQNVENDPKNGKRRLTVAVEDNDGIRFSLTLDVESQRTLDKMQINFERRPEQIYKSIYSILAGNAEFLF